MSKGFAFHGTDQGHHVTIVETTSGAHAIVDGQDLGEFASQEDALQAASDEVEGQEEE